MWANVIIHIVIIINSFIFILSKFSTSRIEDHLYIEMIDHTERLSDGLTFVTEEEALREVSNL